METQANLDHINNQSSPTDPNLLEPFNKKGLSQHCFKVTGSVIQPTIRARKKK